MARSLFLRPLGGGAKKEANGGGEKRTAPRASRLARMEDSTTTPPPPPTLEERIGKAIDATFEQYAERVERLPWEQVPRPERSVSAGLPAAEPDELVERVRNQVEELVLLWGSYPHLLRRTNDRKLRVAVRVTYAGPDKPSGLRCRLEACLA